MPFSFIFSFFSPFKTFSDRNCLTREWSDYEKGDVECSAKADPDPEDNNDLFNKIKIHFVSHTAKSVKIESINLI